MTRAPQTTRLTFLFTLSLFFVGCIGWLAQSASAAIVLTSVAEVDHDETSATVVDSLFAGSSSSNSVGVANYQVDVDLSGISFYLSTPITLDDVTPAGFPSEWRPQGGWSFGGFTSGGATLNGTTVSFTGEVGSQFSGNAIITSHTETSLHHLGTIVMHFNRVEGNQLNLELAPLNTVFEGYDPTVLSGILLPLSTSSSGSTFTIEGINVVPEPGSAAMLLGLLTYPLLSRRRK